MSQCCELYRSTSFSNIKMIWFLCDKGLSVHLSKISSILVATNTFQECGISRWNSLNFRSWNPPSIFIKTAFLQHKLNPYTTFFHNCTIAVLMWTCVCFVKADNVISPPTIAFVDKLISSSLERLSRTLSINYCRRRVT